MSLEPPDTSSEPYAGQTQTNTGSEKWLSSYQTIKADFGSIAAYALNMFTAAQDLQPAVMALFQIPELINEAFRSGGMNQLPEGELAAVYSTGNFQDLTSMLNDLHVGLQNTAFAAQTISDSYHLTDGMSAHDLNSVIKVDGVDFAFGMGGSRPEGLDKRIGETWAQDEQKEAIKASKAGANAPALNYASDPNQLGGKVAVTWAGPNGIKDTTITYQDGSKIIIEESGGGGGATIRDTYIVGADGNVQSSSREITTTKGGTTTVVSQAPNKNGEFHETGRQSTTTKVDSTGAKVTTTKSSSVQKGKETPNSTTVKTQNPDGSTETDTTTITQEKGGKTSKQTDKLAVGGNDGDISDQKGANDPKAQADKKDTTFTQRALT
ncbi:hypothetical protein GCM10023322_39820 [Rugosimonospora acidiphila]|uniref:YD repeat-containing protein n=1 Tax=Rugosimonospora acidiphila TaxID=556531 RepID=A0ABP9RX27_9ACTN